MDPAGQTSASPPPQFRRWRRAAIFKQLGPGLITGAAGDFAFAFFSLGIVGTGLLSVPVLAGSAAYAFGEAKGWACGLENKPWEAVDFYSIIAAATLFGLAIGCPFIYDKGHYHE